MLEFLADREPTSVNSYTLQKESGLSVGQLWNAMDGLFYEGYLIMHTHDRYPQRDYSSSVSYSILYP